MSPKFLFLLIYILSCPFDLSGCASFHYTKPDNLQASCTDAAKKKWAHYSTSCKMLKEISYKEHQRAITAGNDWIKSHNLNHQQIQNLRRGTVWIGMPADAAKLAWGLPKIVTKAHKLRHYEEWKYASGNSLFINDGKVTEIYN